jgi:hypothetical protein
MDLAVARFAARRPLRKTAMVGWRTRSNRGGSVSVVLRPWDVVDRQHDRGWCHRPLQLTALVAAFTAVSAGAALADLCTAPLPKRGEHFGGIVRYVGDGDSLCVGKTANGSEWIEVRLADFYAPELRAPGGQAAKRTLEKIALDKPVECIADHRSYDRIVARCTVQGFSIGDVMRRAGVREGGNGR